MNGICGGWNSREQEWQHISQHQDTPCIALNLASPRAAGKLSSLPRFTVVPSYVRVVVSIIVKANGRRPMEDDVSSRAERKGSVGAHILPSEVGGAGRLTGIRRCPHAGPVTWC